MTALCFLIRFNSFFNSISQTYHFWICFFFIYVVWISIEIGKTYTFFFFAPFWSCFFMDFFKEFSKCFPPLFLWFSSGFPPVFFQFSSGFLPVFLWEISFWHMGFFLMTMVVFHGKLLLDNFLQQPQGFDRSKNLSSLIFISSFSFPKFPCVFVYFSWKTSQEKRKNHATYG